MIEETWKPVRGYETAYAVSNLGRVKRLARVIICRNGMPKPLAEKILTPHLNTAGYYWHQLTLDGCRQFYFVHRLVADAFIPNPNQKSFVNHKSGVKTENVAANLEWVTRQENISHAFASGLMSHAREKNSQSKLTREKAAAMRAASREGQSPKAIAVAHGVSRRLVYDVLSNKAWSVAA